MRYGIYDIRKACKDEDIVRCNNCEHYFYVDCTDERDDNSLKLFEDNDLPFEYKEFFKGCPICETDAYLIDVDLANLSEYEISALQQIQPNANYIQD